MKSYGQYCQVAIALEVVGERWTLLVIRELMCGSRRFGEILNGVPRMPRSMLARRLQQLEEFNLLERHEGDDGPEYVLTERGAALEDVLASLGIWSRRHVYRRLRDDELDTALLMWDMRRNVDESTVPSGVLLLRVEFEGGSCGFERYWLKIQNGVADLCLTNPGFEESLVIRTHPRALAEVWAGQRGFAQAIADGDIQVEGARALVQALPKWFRPSPFAEADIGGDEQRAE